jgi:hypothetical protein
MTETPAQTETTQHNATQMPPTPEVHFWRPGRAMLVAALVGLLAGCVLYLPWDTVWNLSLRQASARISRLWPGVRVDWQNVDRAGPLGFRINGLSVQGPEWLFMPRLTWVDVRLGASPLLVLRAESGGKEAKLVYANDGAFVVKGQLNLACLGRRDITGFLELVGEGVYKRQAGELEKGFLNLSGQSLNLPDALWLGEMALALDYRAGALRIRTFTLREPVQLRAEGTASFRPESPLGSTYAVSGEIVHGQTALPFTSEGVLGDYFGVRSLIVR